MTKTEQHSATIVAQASGARAQAWASYRAWNIAVADVIYPVAGDAVPVYMDLEDDVLDDIATAAGYHDGDPAHALADAVRGVTIIGGRFDLGALATETRRWVRLYAKEANKQAAPPPPCLAFLAVTVRAAEEMGNEEEGIASLAYYARLARLLRLKHDDHALRAQYPRHAEFLWRCLNMWLETLDGERGLPTAYALTYRFVGLPMSQALVRDHDRRRFPSMFTQFGLSPGMRLAPEDLVRYLGVWVSTEGSSATSNLRRLWGRADSHERIASVAAVELANWDGVVEDQSTAVAQPLAARSLTVIANLRAGFMNSSLDLSLGLRPLVADMDGAMEVLATDGAWLALRFSPGTAGLWRTAYSESIDFRSMLEGVVRIRHAGNDASSQYRHSPRMVVPLVYDELQSAYVESERLQLGVDALLLVRSAGTTVVAAGAVDEVEQVLQRTARPGFKKIEELNGLPEGWVLFTGVQLFGAPPASTKYNELVPMARNQLTIAGGLRIPSRIRKWSTLSRPEIRATVQSEKHLRVALSGSMGEERLHEWSSNTGALVVSLDEVALDDGDYQVALYTGSKNTPVQQASIRLRSSDEVDVQWYSAPRLVYTLDNPTGVLSASDDQPGACIVDGLASDGASGVEPSVAAGSQIVWGQERTPAKAVTVQIGSPDPKSCVVTGAHRIQLPPAMGGHAPKYIQGECTSCGLVKRYPGWLPRYGQPRSAKNGADAAGMPSAVVVHDLTEVGEHDVNWDAALDSLMHLGGGPIGSLESIAMQLEGSALFVDNFIRALESLGHLAIERDDRWRPARWEISPSCLGQTATGDYRMVGYWPTHLKEQIETRAEKFGAEVVTKRRPSRPTDTYVNGVSDDDAQTLSDDADAEIAIAAEAGAAILNALPRLSAVAEALPRVSLPGFQAAERFDIASAEWIPTGDLHASGAYRLRRGFETRYIYRSSADSEAATAAFATVHLVKHLAANDLGKSLASYQEKSQCVVVPMGADLPGLYGRAAVALAGRLPVTSNLTIKGRTRKCLVYKDIERESADLLATLLSS